MEKLKPIAKIEIKFDNGTQEICKVIKKFTNGDYRLERKGQNRIELVSYYGNDHLLFKYKDNYVWVEVFLKNTKSHQQVMVRRIE